MGKVRRVAVVTTSRADYGIWRPVMSALLAHPDFEAGWVVTGSHLLAHHGMTIRRIEEDDAPIWTSFACLDGDAEQNAYETARAMARAVEATAQWVEEIKPDAVMVLGDRFEMFAVTSALVPFRVPVIHVHGGEVTTGAIDESFRHAMTKLAHVHLTSTQAYANRVLQLGEEPWRVRAVGAPALDGILASVADEVEDVPVPDGAFVLATYHPETNLESGDMPMVEAMLTALEQVDVPVIFTAPNADPKGDEVRRRLEHFMARRVDGSRLVESFGVPMYYHVMRRAACMFGNSSSGLLEAASFGLPVINLGGRQEGRLRAQNVRDVPNANVEQITQALDWALDPKTRCLFEGMVNPYGDGAAANRMLEVLTQVLDHPMLLRKRFVDIKGEQK